MGFANNIDRVVRRLLEVRSLDVDPSSGKLFSYIYETGDPGVREVARKAYETFLDTNALDPTVFRSALFFEREIVAFAKGLTHGSDDVVGTVTYGGTESIMLAVRAAREAFRRRVGSQATPRVVAPKTVHPSIKKAADYLGLRITLTGVNPETKKADVEAIKEELGGDVALVVVSAPNYPYGTVDPVKDIAEVAADKGIPVHVDACIGGFILPFMERLGERVETFDFRIEGVSSVSMDVHKYGYAPKGSSVLLFRGKEPKKGSLYVDLTWPGYPLINTTVLSSRTIAPLAAAWAVIEYLGVDGYLEMTRRALRARDRILEGLGKLGFKLLAPIEGPILSLALDSEEDLFRFHANMTRRGWIIGLQPKVSDLAPYNIHLTVTPIHEKVSDKFLEDADKAVREPMPEELTSAERLVEENPLAVAEMIGKTPYDSILIAWLLSAIPPELAEEMARELVVEVYRP